MVKHFYMALPSAFSHVRRQIDATATIGDSGTKKIEHSSALAKLVDGAKV